MGRQLRKEQAAAAAARWLFERDPIRRFKGDIYSKIYKRDLAEKKDFPKKKQMFGLTNHI